jgi:hypothetical protein
MIYQMIYRRVHLDGYNARAGSKPVLRTMEQRDSSESHSCDGTTIRSLYSVLRQGPPSRACSGRGRT